MKYNHQSTGVIAPLVLILSVFLFLVNLCAFCEAVKKKDVKEELVNEIRLYNKKQFEGRYIKLKLDKDCVNLPISWEKQVVSVDPMGCVILYAEQDCRGLRRRLERWSWGSSNLKDISFDNMITSLSACPIVKKIVIPTDDEL